MPELRITVRALRTVDAGNACGLPVQNPSSLEVVLGADAQPETARAIADRLLLANR